MSRISLFVPLTLSAALLAACAGGGAAATPRPGSVVPPSSAAVAPAPMGSGAASPHAIRRTKAAGTCTGAGSASFNGVPANGNVAHGAYSVVAGGNQNLGCDDYAAITGGYQNAIASGNNAAAYANIGGGYQNQIYASSAYSAILGGYGNVVDATNGNSVTLGGGAFNSASSAGAALLGGTENADSGFVGVLVGGKSNTESGDYGFDGGGYTNTVSNTYAAIAGGEFNVANGEGAYIGGGGYNVASGEGAIVDGGFSSTAGGTFSTVPGGYRDSAGGTYSFAAGAFASAANEGAFVWSDGSNGSTLLTSSHTYQFLARAAGGFTLYTNAGATVGAQLAAGSGTWASLSDRNAKTNIVPLDDATVLAKVAALPISRWSYKTEHGVRHVGPMAQDFFAAFKVGEDDKHITSIDEDGVALAAIKALNGQNAVLRADNATLHADNATLHASVHELRSQLAALRALVERNIERDAQREDSAGDSGLGGLRRAAISDAATRSRSIPFAR